MFLTDKQEKQFNIWARKTYGKELSFIEAQQIGNAWKGFCFYDKDEKEALKKIKVDPEYRYRELQEIRKQESEKRIAKARDWLSHQDQEIFSKSFKREIVVKRKQAALFLRDNLELSYKEIAEVMKISLAGARWICEITKA